MTAPVRLGVTGHYAGALSRAAAAAADVGIIFGLFTLGLAGLDLLSRLLLGISIAEDRSGPVWAIAFAGWAFVYVFVGLAVAGRTPGKGLVGLRVVMADGSTLSTGRAFVRTIAFPISGVLFGIGYLMVLVQREHRALHDLIAGTAVVYDWGERTAEIPGPLSEFLARRAGAEYTAAPPTERKEHR